MSPIVGSLAGLSARSLGWGLSSPAATFELIQTQVLASSAASVTFNLTAGQQATYKHLQLRAVARDTAAVGQVADILQFNGDTGANYAIHRLIGGGSTVSAYNTPSATYIMLNAWNAASSGASMFGASVVDVLDAFNTSKYKTVRSLGGNAGLNNEIGLNSGLWMNTAAISSLTITANASFISGSRFSLYGVRG